MSGCLDARGSCRRRAACAGVGGFVAVGEVAGTLWVFSLAPAGAHGGFNAAKQVETTKCAFASVATAVCRGRRAKPGIPTGLWREPTRCAVRLPPRSGYAAVAVAGRGR